MKPDEIRPPIIPEDKPPEGSRSKPSIEFVARCVGAGIVYGFVSGGCFAVVELAAPGNDSPDSEFYIPPIFGFLPGAVAGIVLGLITGALVGVLHKHTHLWWSAGLIASVPGLLIALMSPHDIYSLLDVLFLPGPSVIACTLLAIAAAQYKSNRPKMPLVKWVQDADN